MPIGGGVVLWRSRTFDYFMGLSCGHSEGCWVGLIFPLLSIVQNMHMHWKREFPCMIGEAAVSRNSVIPDMSAVLPLCLEGTLILESSNTD